VTTFHHDRAAGQPLVTTSVETSRWPDAFAVAFVHSFETRIAMIRHFYAGGYIKPLD
jgi:hypothetical protein